MLQDHLPDEVLNEKLDQTLAPGLNVEVEAHLMGCPLCTARLDEMRSLFSEIASIPNLPIANDLSQAILGKIVLRPSSLPRPIRWLTVLQIICVLFSAILAWPLVETIASTSRIPTLDIFITNLTSSDWFLAMLNLQWPLAGIEVPRLGLDLTSSTLTITVAITFLLWLTTNSLLLRHRIRRDR
jgi:hypothetical protein